MVLCIIKEVYVCGRQCDIPAHPDKYHPGVYRISHYELGRAFKRLRMTGLNVRMETGIVDQAFAGKFGADYAVASCRVTVNGISRDVFYGECNKRMLSEDVNAFTIASERAQDKAILDFLGLETRYFAADGTPLVYASERDYDLPKEISKDCKTSALDAASNEDSVEYDAAQAVSVEEIKDTLSRFGIEARITDRPWLDILKYRISDKFGDRRDFIHVGIPMVKGEDKHSILSLPERIVAMADSFDPDLYYTLFNTVPSGPYGFYGTTADFVATGATKNTILDFADALSSAADVIAEKCGIQRKRLLDSDASIAEWFKAAFPYMYEDSFISKLNVPLKFSDIIRNVKSVDIEMLEQMASRGLHMAEDENAIGMIRMAAYVRSECWNSEPEIRVV